MDSLTIVDPGRLRVPFGGGCKTPRKQSWMTVSVPAGMEPYDGDGSVSASCVSAVHSLNCNQNYPRESNMQDAVVDISRQSGIKLSIDSLMHQNTGHNLSGRQPLEHHWEIKGWVLSVGHSVFGLALALCNLISSAYTSRVCTAMSPIPMACLLLQALFCMDHGMRQRNVFFLEVWSLMISALILPAACVLWNLYISIPLILLLSLSVVSCLRQRGVLVWVCVSGVCLSLVVATPTPAVNFIEPKWGMTVALFFLGVLCFMAGISYGSMEIKIRYL